MKKLLLLSNSRNPNEERFAWAETELKDFLGTKIQTIAFVPYAAVTLSFDDYTAWVQEAFSGWGYAVKSVHTVADPRHLVETSDAVLVGGGNSFCLTHRLYETGLMETIKTGVNNGKPYIGWSAGANMAAPTMRTTNDMPIVQPRSFDTFGFIPFQINPHYTNETLPNHGGETRNDRLNEFVAFNPGVKVVGLPEGCLLRIENDRIKLVGQKPICVFESGAKIETLYSHDDLNLLL